MGAFFLSPNICIFINNFRDKKDFPAVVLGGRG